MAPTAPSTRRADIDLAAIGHPRGTLAIVAIFGLLFLLAWLATYLFVFIGRGAPHQ
jgi:hypothetical protein